MVMTVAVFIRQNKQDGCGQKNAENQNKANRRNGVRGTGPNEGAENKANDEKQVGQPGILAFVFGKVMASP